MTWHILLVVVCYGADIFIVYVIKSSSFKPHAVQLCSIKPNYPCYTLFKSDVDYQYMNYNKVRMSTGGCRSFNVNIHRFKTSPLIWGQKELCRLLRSVPALRVCSRLHEQNIWQDCQHCCCIAGKVVTPSSLMFKRWMVQALLIIFTIFFLSIPTNSLK